MQKSSFDLGRTSSHPLIMPKRPHDDAEFDITAMIDLVFMMNIYFLVTFLTTAMGEVDLPAASHVAPLDPETAVVLTVVAGLNDEEVTVYLADGPSGEPLVDEDEQEKAIREAVEHGAETGKTAVLIKAEKDVCLRDMFRIMAASAMEGLKLHVAVMEMEKST